MSLAKSLYYAWIKKMGNPGVSLVYVMRASALVSQLSYKSESKWGKILSTVGLS